MSSVLKAAMVMMPTQLDRSNSSNKRKGYEH